MEHIPEITIVLTARLNQKSLKHVGLVLVFQPHAPPIGRTCPQQTSISKVWRLAPPTQGNTTPQPTSCLYCASSPTNIPLAATPGPIAHSLLHRRQSHSSHPNRLHLPHPPPPSPPLHSLRHHRPEQPTAAFPCQISTSSPASSHSLRPAAPMTSEWSTSNLHGVPRRREVPPAVRRQQALGAATMTMAMVVIMEEHLLSHLSSRRHRCPQPRTKQSDASARACAPRSCPPTCGSA